jgi:hypothetical protein
VAESLFLGEGRLPIVVAVASAHRAPGASQLRDLWHARHGNTPSPLLLVVLHPGAAAGPTAEAVPARQLNLDRSLVGGTRATFVPMPDATMTAAGIHEGDLLLVEPIAVAELEAGDVVVASLAGVTTVRRWGEPGGRHFHADAAIGRVTAIFRRLRVPTALVTAHEGATADAAAPVT